MRRPNIVFLLTDDQRFDTIHALGNPDIRTPNLDELAARGTAFTHAHIPGGTSPAVCMPSRAMLHTGRSLGGLQGQGQDIPCAHTTLGEALQGGGYRCFGAGKWHNGPPAFSRSFQGGEKIFFGGMWDHWNLPTNRYDPTGAYDNVVNFVVDFWQTNKTTPVRCDECSHGAHSTDLLTDAAVGFLQRQSKDAADPFFMYVAYLAPHDPRTMPQRFRDMYDEDALRLPDNVWPQHPFAFGVEDIRDETLAPYPRPQSEVRRHLAEYYAMITHLDDALGRIVQTLKAQGLYEDTIIVWTGDNGLAVGQHGLMGKQSLYEHSVRVPLVFAGPGIPQGARRDDLVLLMDIFPTLCELLGLPVPPSVQGLSFAPALLGQGGGPRRELYLRYCAQVNALKDARYKLLNYPLIGRRCFFDLEDDPQETRDLIDDPAHCSRIRAMQASLNRHVAADAALPAAVPFGAPAR